MLLVSVIIPAYNRRHRIGRALQSVLRQDVEAMEVIVVDDGSTDDTAKVAEEYLQVSGACPAGGGIRFKVLRLSPNQGSAAARNLGMRHAAGRYLAFLDSDDEWPAGSLARRVAALEDHKDVDLLFSDFETVQEGTVVEASFLHSRFVWKQLRYSREKDVCRAENFFDCQLIQPLVTTSTVLLRRESLGIGEVFDEDLRLVQDWEFWLRLSRAHPVAFIDAVWVRRHLGDDNVTRNREAYLRGVIKAGGKVLRTYGLPRAQRNFLRRRLASDLFDLAYHLYWVRSCRKESWIVAARSCLCRPSRRAGALLLYGLLPGRVVTRARGFLVCGADS